ncbi:predicted protein [Plenodomus lingam JN3]|uniref:Predicted protein n=1 Tax=Leptosphaeria maculans (strain JN3 / isolate v23.1.3 / race Av1-4-5-6-7-8) TaxID=985895 RepID=E5ACY7_LEPMJ|nr:predicted protein [Plenodomus lingam JN3]CBY02339.1 predicted protein [Plenodomus lingam JN3]
MKPEQQISSYCICRSTQGGEVQDLECDLRIGIGIHIGILGFGIGQGRGLRV